jgi:hypothetical protein
MPRVMMRLTMAVSFVASLTMLLGVGCGDSFDEEDAVAECDAQRARIGNGVTDAAYQQCLDCYQECGEECAVVDTVSPTLFSCPAE